METAAEEVMLAQEQGVRMRRAGKEKELEGALGGELEGTLILTNRRLIFVCTDEREDDLTIKGVGGKIAGEMRLVYSDVEDLTSIPSTGGNLFVPLSSITSVKGHAGHVERPSLEVDWRDGNENKGRVFIERLSGRSRRRNLNDWATVIERLKTGHQKLTQLPRTPPVDSLDGKIMRVLADMQRKGVFEIEEDVETQFQVNLDPDDVQAACQRLTGMGLIEKSPDPTGDLYYEKRSPLGDDAL
jgi:hypothetical protein